MTLSRHDVMAATDVARKRRVGFDSTVVAVGAPDDSGWGAGAADSGLIARAVSCEPAGIGEARQGPRGAAAATSVYLDRGPWRSRVGACGFSAP